MLESMLDISESQDETEESSEFWLDWEDSDTSGGGTLKRNNKSSNKSFSMQQFDAGLVKLSTSQGGKIMFLRRLFRKMRGEKNDIGGKLVLFTNSLLSLSNPTTYVTPYYL